MKAKFLTAILLLCVSLGFSQELDSIEITLYSEINTYVNQGYYPGVIEKVEQMEQNYPESVFIIPSRLSKSEALIQLGRYEEAEESLNKVLPAMYFGNEDLDKCWYLFGKTQFYLDKKDKALQSFYNCCTTAKKADNYRYYHSAVFYSGRIYYLQENYQEAEPLFEYVVTHGKNFGKNDYYEACQKLILCYNSLKQYDKTISLYEQLDLSAFPVSVSSFINFYGAEAYEKTGDYLKAYNLYCGLIENKDRGLAVSSLKNAYLISHAQKLDVNTSDLLNKIKENQEGFSSILSDFWTRLGIDAYNSKDFKKARECFNYAQENKTEDTDLVIQLYEIKMKLDEGLTPEQAKKVCVGMYALESRINASKVPHIQDSYYSILLHCRALNNEWVAVKSCFDNILYPDDEALYYGAAAYFKTGNYAEAESIIKDCKLPKAAALHANILGRQNRNQEAAEIYVALNASRSLSNEDRLEFAKVLYNQKKYDAAYKHAKTANQPHSTYICGLCSIKTGNWADAIVQLDTYYKKYSKEYGYGDEAFFYKSLAEYKSADYKKAYADFEYFGNLSTPNLSYIRRAYSYAAKSAVLMGDYEKASVQAEKLRKISFNEKDKQEAIIFCAEIYTDSGNYNQAVNTLEPYTRGKSDFALKCLYSLADIYERKGDLAKSDELYEKIFNEFPKTVEAEESLYRRGELYLSRRNYAEAEIRFTAYLNNYANGTYADAAYYYCGDCNLQLKNYSKSVMQNKTLISRYPKSTYCYGAMKNILEAFYAEEKYGEALTIAQQIEKKYPIQAVSDGVNKKVIELEKIVGGTDRHIVEKQAEYDKNGNTSTKKGRNAGSELVKLYAVYGSRQDAFNLAMELIPLQKERDEFYSKAENCDFVAAYYKETGDNSNAASMYLKAAEYYRSSGNDKTNKAAAALYAAVDCFASENMRGDAQQTAALLIKLYPESRQARSVNSLLNQEFEL